MYCPKCGTENPDDARICSSCGSALKIAPADSSKPVAKTSGLAIASLVLALLSPFTCMIAAIPAIILAIVALVRISKSQGQLKGNGLAITGLALPFIILPIIGILMGILMPALARARQVAYRQLCATNISILGKAMLIYAGDYDEKYPTSSKWCDLLIECTDVAEEQFRCKGAFEGPCNYAMNENAEIDGTASPPDMVLLFETSPGWNQVGGSEILTTDNHQREGCNILFADLHVEFVKTEDLANLRWTPE
jgi:prepilin-type processing-associated H-X9-DG protein